MTDEPANAVQPYDFRKPMRLAGDLEQRMFQWQHGICPLVQEKWAQNMATAPTWQTEPPESARSDDAVAALPDAIVGYVVRIEAIDAESLVVFPAQLVLAVVGGMLGETFEQLPEERALTDIEDALFALAVEDLVCAIGESLPVDETLACRLTRTELKPKRSRVFGCDDSVITMSFDVAFPFGRESCYWLLAEHTASAVFEQYAPSNPVADETGKRELEANVRELPVKIVVRLGDTTMHVADLSALQVGDVVVLEQRVTDPLTAEVSGHSKFRGWPGKVGPRQALRIAGVCGD